MTADKERKKMVLDYIRQSNTYSFENFIREHHLDKNVLYRSSDMVIECPFHEDLAPSCSLNDSIGAFQCFSCGRHGTYIDFLVMYSNEIGGINTNFYQMLNSILREDRIMQASLGFSTIYTGSTYEIKQSRKRFKAIEQETHVTSYVELVDELRKHSCVEKQVKLCISLIQKGFQPDEILRIMKG